MCFHGARFDARVAVDGAIALLEEQDRCAWNWSDVREGMAWLARSAAGDELTRYHVEAGIAWGHCRAPTFAGTDWRRIAEWYDTLARIAPSARQRNRSTTCRSLAAMSSASCTRFPNTPTGGWNVCPWHRTCLRMFGKKSSGRTRPCK